MSESNPKIEKLEKQIRDLQEKLRKEKQKQDSLWNKLYENFLAAAEEMSDTEAETLTNVVQEGISRWIVEQREKIGERFLETRVFPKYTDCLNDLALSLARPGSSAILEVEPIEASEHSMEPPISIESTVYLPEPPVKSQGPTEEPPSGERINPFSRRVNVPKAMPVAIEQPFKRP